MAFAWSVYQLRIPAFFQSKHSQLVGLVLHPTNKQKKFLTDHADGLKHSFAKLIVKFMSIIPTTIWIRALKLYNKIIKTPEHAAF